MPLRISELVIESQTTYSNSANPAPPITIAPTIVGRTYLNKNVISWVVDSGDLIRLRKRVIFFSFAFQRMSPTVLMSGADPIMKSNIILTAILVSVAFGNPSLYA